MTALGPRHQLSFHSKIEPAARQTVPKRGAARDELLAVLAEAGWAPELDVFKVEPPGNSVHYGGTCRMHASPKYGVVDRFCRVFGARKVVVADSAVFTTGPEKNRVLTAMTFAARTAERLADVGRRLSEGSDSRARLPLARLNDELEGLGARRSAGGGRNHRRIRRTRSRLGAQAERAGSRAAASQPLSVLAF
jgi:GMC oxidoreductase